MLLDRLQYTGQPLPWSYMVLDVSSAKVEKF